jgi:hypothetical protein
MVLETRRANGDPAPNVTGATLVAICESEQSTAATISTVSGVATLSTDIGTPAVGDHLIYDNNGWHDLFIETVSSDTSFTVVKADGSIPADITGKAVNWLGKSSLWKHTFKIHPTNKLPSMTIERGYLDLDTPQYFQYLGCKVNSMQLSFGGDGQLVCNMGVMGADEVLTPTAYDNGITSYNYYIDEFQNFEATIKEGNVASDVIKTFSLEVNNNLDGSAYVIAGAGKRKYMPEGIASVTGNVNALFENTSLLAKATADTETSIEYLLTKSSGESLKIKLNELTFAPKSPSVSGPSGVVVDLNYSAYYLNDSSASAVIVELVNSHPQY